jgi:hypothetical protein
LWLTGIIGILAVTHFGFELAVMGLTYVEENLSPAISREDLTNILLFRYKFPRYDQLHILEVQIFLRCILKVTDNSNQGYFTTALALAAVLDILIAGILVYLLNQQKSGIKRCVCVSCIG